MGSVTRHPSADRYEAKLKRENESREAKAAVAKHRRFLQDTKPKRDAARARRRRIRFLLDEIDHVAYEARGEDTIRVLQAALRAAKKAAAAIRRNAAANRPSPGAIPDP